jgi:hypothetical protein
MYLLTIGLGINFNKFNLAIIMFNKNKKISLLFVLIIFFSACAVSPAQKSNNSITLQSNIETNHPPQWVLGKEHLFFPMSDYIVGRGISKESSVTAAENARMDLAKTIKVKIRSKMMDFSTNDLTKVKSVIESEVEAVLEGVEIRDGWFDLTKNNYYSYAVMNRKIASQSVRNRISLVSKRLHWHLHEGIKAAEKNDISSALASYASGYIESPDLESLTTMLNVIDQTVDRKNYKPETPNQLTFESEAKNILDNISLSIISGNKQYVELSKIPKDPLTIKIYLRKNLTNIPLVGIPVKFKYANGAGVIDEHVQTNDQGIAQSLVRNIKSYKQMNHRVLAGINLTKIIPNVQLAHLPKFFNKVQNLKAVFNINVETTNNFSAKSNLLRKNTIDLAHQVIHNINPDSNPVLGIFNFQNFHSGKSNHNLSRIIKKEFESVLSGVKGLTLREIKYHKFKDEDKSKIALDNSLDVYVTGGYRLVGDNIEIRARLIEATTNNIRGFGRIEMMNKNILPNHTQFTTNSNSFISNPNFNESYNKLKERLIDLKPTQTPFEVKLSTDKAEYRIGEKVNFFIETNRSCYLTLLDFSPDGTVTVIFPNGNHKDSLISARKIYQIPPTSPSGANKPFSFIIQEPSGLDRIKAFCDLTKPSPLKLTIKNRTDYHTIKPKTTKGLNDLKKIIESFPTDNTSQWAEAYKEVFIFEKNITYMRGKKTIPILEKPEKPKDMIGTFGNELPKPNNQRAIK